MREGLLATGVEFLAVENEAATEVFFADHGVLGQLFGSALEKDFPFKEKVGAVGDAERLLSVVVGDKDTDIFLFQTIDYLLDILNGNRVYSGKRLIKHDKLGIDSQTAGYLRATALTA